MPGLRHKFVEEIKQSLVCPLCRLPMRDPVRITSCGHRFCDTCLQEYLSEGIFKCPEDKQLLDYAKIYPDVDSERDIRVTRVHCDHYIDGCPWTDKLHLLKTHMDQCLYNQTPCPNQCSAMLTRLLLDDHVQYTCPRRLVTCEVCNQSFTGEAMEAHHGNCPMDVVWCENKCGARLQQRYVNNHMRNECHKRTMPCSYCKKDFVFDTLQSHFYQCPRLPITCPNRCDTVKIPREEIESHLIEECPSATISCSFSNMGCKHLSPRHSMDKHLDVACKQHLQLVCRVVQQQEKKIQELSDALWASKHVTEGCFLWKISNIRSKILEAKSHQGDSELKSEPFYTSRYGYKLGVSLFPNGNGSGEGSHVSLYIRVINGDYDNLLEWPFRLPICFKLLDQGSDVDKRQSIKESFVPNPSWKHFQKPGANMESLGFGYPKFVSLETLKSGTYIRDDAIFIQIQVDASKSII